MISNKKTCFSILDCLIPGDKFTGYNLMQAVKNKTGKTLYPASALRYLREYRNITDKRIINVDKMKSIYEVV